VDADARRVVLELPGVLVNDAAHAREHSLEVHLPFLARVLGEIRVLPLVVGRAEPDTVADVLDAVWGGPETLVVVSSDLSHYLDHTSATRRDERTAAAIVAGDIGAVGFDDACGAICVRGFLLAAGRHELDARILDLRNSGDTSGPRDRVVGYGAFAFSGAPT
jgi:AmmeMemoRadiSam system protein B